MEQQIEQRSLEWKALRLGKFTGSEVGKLMTKGRSKDQVFGATALSYIYKVAMERMLCKDQILAYIEQSDITTKAMQWGIDNEDDARNKCAEVYGVNIEECPFIKHPTIKGFGASPDGYIVGDEERGVVEIKCTGIANYGNYMFNLKDAESLKSINSDYYWQVQAEMACSGASYCIFFVYCPFVEKKYVSIRIERDETIIQQLEERVVLANEFINNNKN